MGFLSKLANPFGSSSHSSSDSNSTSTQANTTTTNTSTDNRLVVDGGGVGASGGGVVNMVDPGAVQAGRDVSMAALANNATNTDKLLQTAGALFRSQEKAMEVSAGLATALAAKATGTEDTGLNTPTAALGGKAIIAAGLVGALYFLSKRG